MWTSNVVPAEIVRRPPGDPPRGGLRIFWNRQFNCEKRTVFDIKPDSLNLVWITDDEQRLEEDQEDESEGPQPTPYNPLIFWPAALCDMTATSIQYIALTLTYASSFQMLRGKTKHLFFCMRVLSVVWFHFSDNFTACQCRWKVWKIKMACSKIIGKMKYLFC